MSVMYTRDEVKERLEFHESKVVELVLTGEDPVRLELHRKQVKRFKKLRMLSLYEDVDITTVTK